MPEQLIYGRLVLPDRVQEGGLLIRDGRIVEIVPRAAKPANAVDYGDAYVLPGLIEVHGHLREPGLSHKENYLTGTRAAVAGGVTTILDMPNTNPPTTTIAALRAKEQIAAGRAYCDYAMIFGSTANNQADIAQLAPDDVVGVKFFMAGHETTPTVVANLGDLYASVQIVRAKGLVALFHAENQQLIDRLANDALAIARDDGRAYSETRGPLVAKIAVAEALAICAELDVPAYLCHVSTRGELIAIADARRQGATVYAEAVGYHLTFTIDDYDQLGTWLKVSPPVREAIERDALWAAVCDGTISTIASEHTPHTRDEKNRPMSAAASGMPGIQENLAMIVTQYRARCPSVALDTIVHDVAQLGSTQVARIFGLSARKGSLEVGKDADFSVLDTTHPWIIDETDLFSKCGWSAYTGRTASCRVIATYVRGENVYTDGQVIGAPGGVLIKRTQVR